MARVHEAYLQFESKLNGDDLMAAQTAFNEIDVTSGKRGLSYKFLGVFSPVYKQYAEALIKDHDRRQRLFAWLEAKAGKPKKRFLADGTPVN